MRRAQMTAQRNLLEEMPAAPVGWPLFGEERRQRQGPSFHVDTAFTAAPSEAVVIVHSLAVSVEQLCARSPDAASIDFLRPTFCVCCGQAARNAAGTLQLVAHGCYARQVRGLSETTWIVIRVRRFLCLVCGHTMSLLPDWLHPFRWYAATAIIEALCRHAIGGESSAAIGERFGRRRDAASWRSLFRWRKQLLVSSSLWGWLGPRLGVREPARGRPQCASRLRRLLTEGGHPFRSVLDFVREVPSAVRTTLRNLVYNRKGAHPIGHFPSGEARRPPPARLRPACPTEKDSGRRPP